MRECLDSKYFCLDEGLSFIKESQRLNVKQNNTIKKIKVYQSRKRKICAFGRLFRGEKSVYGGIVAKYGFEKKNAGKFTGADNLL